MEIILFNKPHKNHSRCLAEITEVYSEYRYRECILMLSIYLFSCPTASGVFECRFFIQYFKRGILFGEYTQDEQTIFKELEHVHHMPTIKHPVEVIAHNVVKNKNGVLDFMRKVNRLFSNPK